MKASIKNFLNYNLNAFKEVQHSSLQNFKNFARIGDKWEDENGHYHYKVAAKANETESFSIINEKCIID